MILRVTRASLERVTLYWPAEIESADEREALSPYHFSGREVAAFQLLAWSDVATLIEPEDLRELLVARARRTLRDTTIRKPSRRLCADG